MNVAEAAETRCVAGGPDRGDLHVRTNLKKEKKVWHPICFVSMS